MKIRVLSDLHIDVNEESCYSKPPQLNDNIFTIVAGDTAGSPEKAIDWIQKNIRKGLVISGNHIVYESKGRPIQDLKQQMAKAFPPESPVTYLDQMTGVMSKQVGDILFIGTTFYTDYTLYPDVSVDWAMREGYRRLNDFRIGYTQDKDKTRLFSPEDYRRWFIESKKEMTRLLKANPDKEVVIITHHCPSAKCCQPPEESLNASYASNLEPFIQEHPNIKLWVCGHAHNQKNFKIGNCLVLMNPKGYECMGESFGFTPNLFVDTKDWSIHEQPASNKLGKHLEKRDKRIFEQMLRLACFEL